MQPIHYLQFIPQVVILVAALYLLNKRRSAAAILIVAAEILSLITSAFQQYVLFSPEFSDTSEKVKYLTAIGGTAMLCSILFTIGFCLLIYDIVNRHRPGQGSTDVLDAGDTTIN